MYNMSMMTIPMTIPITRYKKVLSNDLFLFFQSCSHKVNKEQQSYWMEMEEKVERDNELDRFLVEEIILYIYHNVMRIEIPHLKGIEWWIHVRSPVDSMFMHFDRDEGQWAYSSPSTPAQFPIFSSVFFLSSIGQPLLLVDQRANDLFTSLIPSKPAGGYRVSPTANTFVVFPGSWLHGVERKSQEEIESYSPSLNFDCNNSRITLLMNFWCTRLQDPTCISFTSSDRKSADLQARFGHITKNSTSWDNENPVEREMLVPLSGLDISKLYEFDLTAYQERGVKKISS